MNICCEQVRSIEESNKLLSYPPAYCNRLTRHAATIQQKISPQKPPATTENQSFSSIHSSTINISSRGYSADIPAKGPPVQKNTQQQKKKKKKKGAATQRNYSLQKTIRTTSAHRTARSKPLHQLVPPIVQQNHQTHQQTQFSPNQTQR